MSIGTPEEEIIKPGTTIQELKVRLGNPTRQLELSPTLRSWDLQRQFTAVTMLVTARFDLRPEGKRELVLPEDMAVLEHDYRFTGRLKRKHDAGESASLSIMSLGLWDVVSAPAAIASKASEQPYILTVWADAGGRALAYRWALGK